MKFSYKNVFAWNILMRNVNLIHNIISTKVLWYISQNVFEHLNIEKRNLVIFLAFKPKVQVLKQTERREIYTSWKTFRSFVSICPSLKYFCHDFFRDVTFILHIFAFHKSTYEHFQLDAFHTNSFVTQLKIINFTFK